MNRQTIIRKFVETFGATMWDVRAVKRENDNSVANRKETWDTATFLSRIGQLSLLNSRGCDIYCRPLFSIPEKFPWVFVDDVPEASLGKLKQENPCVVLKSSPGNLQAWFRLAEPVDREMAVRIRRELASRFGGDLASAANPELVGRVPAFTNRKPVRRLPSGQSPLVVMVWRGKTRFQPHASASAPTPAYRASVSKATELDRSRRDWAQACHLAEKGRESDFIAAWLSVSSQKGRERQEYCKLTAEKAISHVASKAPLRI